MHDNGRASPKPATLAVLPDQRTLVVAFALSVAFLFAALGALLYLSTTVGGTVGHWVGGGTASAGRASGVVTPAQIPKVEPVRYLELHREKARQINAAVPFSTEENPPASPLVMQLSSLARARALDCLAAAAWYEVGDDMIGQQAVIQVVLNRVRHPAFPKSVCGVVFQGSERRTGCQFSFTCDGSMDRRKPSSAAWGRARGTASAALGGMVFPTVGWATHYHTDWVIPYWSAKVDKIAVVDTHLFFRWSGNAGRTPAFTGRHSGSEPAISKMATLSPNHLGVIDVATTEDGAAIDVGIAATAAVPSKPVAAPIPVELLRGNRLLDRDAGVNSYLVQIVGEPFAGTLALMSLDICNLQADKPCVLFATSAPEGALNSRGTPVAGIHIDFHYARDQLRGHELAQWDCFRWPRTTPAQCLPGSKSEAR